MKFNSKYKRYVTNEGQVYRVSNGKLVLCKLSHNRQGYLQVCTGYKTQTVHKLVYETFHGEVPKGFDIDHINDIKDDNRLENLRVLSHRDNSLKLSTVLKTYESMTRKGMNTNISHYLMNVTCV